jgi:lysophospholipase L1-like esterase
MTRITLALLAAVALTITALVSSGPARAATQPLSIVQLGDSVASGEGTLYGYQYDSAQQVWTGGNLNATWPGPYPGCHQSPDAYGNVVARNLRARFTSFACTGAQYESGIVNPEINSGVLVNTVLRPAQFGDYATGANLNAAYDAARPDVVLVTLGADDLRFVPVVKDCVENALAAAVSLQPLRCTSTNPGAMITNVFSTNLPMLGPHLQTLVHDIQARGRAHGKVPKIVFTTYHDPLPPGSTRCPDVALLDPAQVSYLGTLVTELNQEITTAIKGLSVKGVALANTSNAMVGPDGTNHRWCSPQPWAYGLSVFKITNLLTISSQAPFHPTPDGQRRFAALVTPVLKQLLAKH